MSDDSVRFEGIHKPFCAAERKLGKSRNCAKGLPHGAVAVIGLTGDVELGHCGVLAHLHDGLVYPRRRLVGAAGQVSSLYSSFSVAFYDTGPGMVFFTVPGHIVHQEGGLVGKHSDRLMRLAGVERSPEDRTLQDKMRGPKQGPR